MKTNNLVACPECDALQREVPLVPHGEAVCTRCGADLFRNKPESLDRTLALVIAAAIVFVGVNTFTLMEFDAQGLRTETTVFGTVLALSDAGWPLIALLVLVTTIVVPGLQMGLSIMILAPVRFGRVPAGLGLLSRLLDTVWPWGMVEVFLLGGMISLVKLAKIATVTTGGALYMAGAYAFLISAAVATFDERSFWARIEELRS
jgi:paraquat-inducible protein A